MTADHYGTIRIYPKADVTLDRNAPDTNFGGEQLLRMYRFTSGVAPNDVLYNTEVWFRFDLDICRYPCDNARLCFTQVGMGEYNYQAYSGGANIWINWAALDYDRYVPQSEQEVFWDDDDLTWGNYGDITSDWSSQDGYWTSAWRTSQYLANGCAEWSMDIRGMFDSDFFYHSRVNTLFRMAVDDDWHYANNDIRMFLVSRNCDTTGYEEYGTVHWPYIEYTGLIAGRPDAEDTPWSQYYVDGFTGNDSNAGTSPSNPWRTMDRSGNGVTSRSVLNIRNDFLAEPVNGNFAPDQLPVKWKHWDTNWSRMKLNYVPASTGNVYAIEDTYIALETPAVVHGLESSMYNRRGPNVHGRVFIKFDISDIAVVNTCTLNLRLLNFNYVADHSGSVLNPTLRIKWTPNNWLETAMTYQTGYPSGMGPTVFIDTLPLVAPSVLTVDVSDIAKLAVAGGYTEMSFDISLDVSWSNNDYYFEYGTKEGGKPAWLKFT